MFYHRVVWFAISDPVRQNFFGGACCNTLESLAPSSLSFARFALRNERDLMSKGFEFDEKFYDQSSILLRLACDVAIACFSSVDGRFFA